MLNNCKLLLRIQLLHTFQLNVLRYSKDKKKKINAVLLTFCYLLIGISILAYVSLLAYSICKIGMAELVPPYILAVTSILTLLFTILKAASILFGAKDYEQLIALPLRPSTIVISRFLTMYLSNLIFVLITMLPSIIIYSMFEPVGIKFILMILISIFFIPLIPMTIATAIGVLITAISSRMKHKTLFTVVISLVATVAVLFISMNANNVDQSMLSDISVTMTEQINKIYPLSPLYSSAIINGNILSFFSFILLSAAVFSLFIVIVSWKYISINSALTSRAAKGTYVLTELQTSSPLKALYKKELRRYLSSALYILNTSIGYLLMMIMSIAILVVGPDQLETSLQIPGFSKTLMIIAPLILSAISCIMPTTVSSISLEGKQWWIALSLPVSSKMVFDSKILVNLTLAIPSLLFSSTLIAIALPFTISGCFLLYLTPLSYILFTSVLGITINANMPTFHWDNEAYVIKQSGATLIAMVIGMLSFAIPLIIIFTVNNVSANVITLITTLVLLGITFLLYTKNNKMKLKMIQDS